MCKSSDTKKNQTLHVNGELEELGQTPMQFLFLENYFHF